MLTLLCALAANRILYAFPPGQKITYSMTVSFDGYLPVLGGKNGSAEADLQVGVTGLQPDQSGNPQVRSEIEGLKMTLNGAVLPITAKNVQAFFPPTTIGITPEGRVLKTDAPDAKLGVQLPGLDAKRFPDVSYLPIEFPAEGIELGKPFQFKKRFGPTDMAYTVTPTRVDAVEIDLSVLSSQDYEGYEDSSHNPAPDSGEYHLFTHVEGKGTVKFDMTRHQVSSAHLEATAKTHVTGPPNSDRELRTVLDVRQIP